MPYSEAAITAVGRITAKGQTTVPSKVRAALHVKAGDLLAWDVGSDGVARVRRVEPLDVAYLLSLEATLTEWSSPEDEAAYRDL